MSNSFFKLSVAALCIGAATCANANEVEWRDYGASSSYHFSTPFPTYQAPPKWVQDQQSLNKLSAIEQEILLIKAELAVQSNDRGLLRSYLLKLERAGILEHFRGRYEELLIALIRMGGDLNDLLVEQSQYSQLNWNRNSRLGLILPLSGKYKEAGNAILQSIQMQLQSQQYPGEIVVEDSALYPSMADLWSSLKYYQPNFIIGPLVKENQTQFQLLEVDTPTIYLNEFAGQLRSSERAVSIGPRARVMGLLEHLFLSPGSGATIVIFDEKSKSLADYLKQQALLVGLGEIEWLALDSTLQVDSALKKSLGTSKSQDRKGWLQKKLGRDIEFRPRARSDVATVVSLLNAAEAIQITPLLEFYDQKEVEHLWCPPTKPDFKRLNFDSWLRTKVFVSPDWMLKSSNPIDVLVDEVESEQTGIFYAFGNIAVSLLKESQFNQPAKNILQTDFGQVLVQENGQAYVLPDIYWINKGIFERLKHDAP